MCIRDSVCTACIAGEVPRTIIAGKYAEAEEALSLIHISDDTPAKGDDPGNGNTELEVNEWIESVMRSDYLWNNDIPAQNKLDLSADPQTFIRSMLSLKDGKTRNGKHLYYYSYIDVYKRQVPMLFSAETLKQG